MLIEKLLVYLTNHLNHSGDFKFAIQKLKWEEIARKYLYRESY